MGLTEFKDTSVEQQKLLAILPRVISAFGVFGSFYVIIDIFKQPKRKMYHRILLGMNIFNCIVCSAFFFTTWPIDPDLFPVWGAKGTQQTCTAQGFFAQLMIAPAIYYGCLGLYYFLVIYKGWSDMRLQKSRIEWGIHVLAVTFSLGTSVVAVALDLYNPVGWFCWIGSYPPKCRESWYPSRNPDGPDCMRGDNAHVFQWMFFYGPLWLLLLLDTVFMCFVCAKFWRQERRNLRWQQHSTGDDQKPPSLQKVFFSSKRLRMIFWQSVLYLGVFYLSTMFSSLLRIHELIENKVYYQWMVLSATFGGLNAPLVMLVYLRPRFIEVRARRQRQQKQAAARQGRSNDAGDACPSQEVDGGDEGDHEPSCSPMTMEKQESARSVRPSTLEKKRSNPVLDTLGDIGKTLWAGDGGLSVESSKDNVVTSTTLRTDGECSELPIPIVHEPVSGISDIGVQDGEE